MGLSVLLGVTGGIAAYKIPMLVRMITTAGMKVNVVMTQNATNFVTPLTLATLSGSKVSLGMWSNPDEPSVEHISLADGASVAVIAPATANFIGKMANGIADDLLTTLALALKCPVIVCPSMNVNMYENPIVQENIGKLQSLGYHVMSPDSGYLACGWSGAGRMPEPEIIFSKIEYVLCKKDMVGLSVLVTAGPTQEPLDPVRFITNRSSGKMGVALAHRAYMRGACVNLVSGPINIQVPHGVNQHSVRTTAQMMDKVIELAPSSDIIIKSAAVADFRPETVFDSKIKKERFDGTVRLTRNPDILKELGSRKSSGQILVGFAAETANALDNARSKLVSKNLDLIVLNDVTQPGAGFDCDTNIVKLIFRTGREIELGIMSKDDVADRILDEVVKLGSSVSGRGDCPMTLDGERSRNV